MAFHTMALNAWPISAMPATTAAVSAAAETAHAAAEAAHAAAETAHAATEATPQPGTAAHGANPPSAAISTAHGCPAAIARMAAHRATRSGHRRTRATHGSAHPGVTHPSTRDRTACSRSLTHPTSRHRCTAARLPKLMTASPESLSPLSACRPRGGVGRGRPGRVMGTDSVIRGLPRIAA